MKKNIRVSEPSPEMLEKIVRARTAIASQKERNLKCPYCLHNAITVYEDTRGHLLPVKSGMQTLGETGIAKAVSPCGR